MTKQILEFTRPDEAWIFHREEIDTEEDGSCNFYILLDAYSGFCFGQEVTVDQPSVSEMSKILKSAREKIGSWPNEILILKKEPHLDIFKSICVNFDLKLKELTSKDLKPIIESFTEAFKEFKRGSKYLIENSASEGSQDDLDGFIPESYSLCPCASGNKFKFCCQKSFRDISIAMCAAENGDLDGALHYMKQAEEKVGLTAEILCRYAICWSFFDMNKFQKYIDKALKRNPKHPRANYVQGIEAVEREEYERAIEFYQTAIDNYPKEDRYHLNETYNNLGSAYFSLKKYKEAKEVWEKALILLPSDQMVRRNLFEFIYENPDIPKPLREISPFVGKFLGC